MEANIREQFPSYDEITKDILEEILNMTTLVPNSSYKPHGEIVVEHYKVTTGLVCLEKVWREYFLTTMKPKYLPEYWSVTHNHERLVIKADRGHVTEEELVYAGVDTHRLAKSEVDDEE